jgi:hypothetical protein
MFAERLAFLGVLGAVLLWAAVAAGGFPDRARIFPQVVSVAALLIVALEIGRMVWSRRKERRDERREETVAGEPPGRAPTASLLAQVRSGAPYLAWFAAYYASIALLGFPAASALFVFAFLGRVARVPLARAAAGALAVVALLLVLHGVLDVRWPAGLLGELTGVGIGE